MAVTTYQDNPVFALMSGANTCNSGYTAKELQAGSLVCHDENGDLDKWKITSATCTLDHTPTADSLSVYTDSGKETELVEDTDYEVDDDEITVLRRDLWSIYAEYTYTSGESTASATETHDLVIATNGEIQGVLVSDHVGDGSDVAYAIGGYIKRSRVLDLNPLAEGMMPKAINLMD